MMRKTWNQVIEHLPGANFLQTEEWARIKEPVGWNPDWRTWPAQNGQVDAAAMILFRSPSRLPLSIAYVPRGPLADWTNEQQYQTILVELIQHARQKKAIFLKIDPALCIGKGIPGTINDRPDAIGLKVQHYLKKSGWLFSQDQIQFRNTVEIDLAPAEDDLLMKMHPKTRYNIRLAEKKGMVVTQADPSDWQAIYHLYAETANRDGFIIRPWDYYKRVWDILSANGMAVCLKAQFNDVLVGAVWMVGFGKKAHYLYGMSSAEHRETMPNHLLQWRAIQLAKSQGREIYDMWGAPDGFTQDDSLSGVFRFKQGFGGEVVRTLGAWDYPISPTSYRLYAIVLPKILNILRNRNRKKNRQMLSN
jgi:peptidoglycan pentaglycine glycine transferase (the first glycine)